MSAAQLARYRRALVHYLKRCRQDQPRYREMRSCLAGVMAEEQARRPTDHASGTTLLVPTYPHVNELIWTTPNTAASIRVMTCGGVR